MSERITAQQFHEADGVEDWRVLAEGACAFFRTGSFDAGVELVQAIGGLAALDERYPDIDIRSDGLTIRLITNSDGYYGLTQRHLELAREISRVARELGLAAEPSVVQTVMIIVEGQARSQVTPFWRAVLDYVPRGDSPEEDLVDPRDRGPAFWFEDIASPGPRGGDEIHVAVWVPHELAEARVAAALAAGGRLVRDRFAPAWWTLADAAGNEADVATPMSRD